LADGGGREKRAFGRRLAKLQVEINEEKKRSKRRPRSRREASAFWVSTSDAFAVVVACGVRNTHPSFKKTNGAAAENSRIVFRRYQSQPLDRVIKLINPMLRGWVAYFAVGNSSECFGFVKRLGGKKKIRRHMAAGPGNRKGFGWKRWNTQWLLRISAAVQRLQGSLANAESPPPAR